MIKNVHGTTLDLLGGQIVAGRYPPGSAIPPEAMLCEELGVSRPVIRDTHPVRFSLGLEFNR